MVPTWTSERPGQGGGSWTEEMGTGHPLSSWSEESGGGVVVGDQVGRVLQGRDSHHQAEVLFSRVIGKHSFSVVVPREGDT